MLETPLDPGSDMVHDSYPDEVEPDQRPVEILHYPNVDVVLNNTARLAAWGPRLAEECQDGIPQTWQTFDAIHQNVRLGDIDGVYFVGKTRTGLEGHPVEELRASGPEGVSFKYTKAQSYAKHSVTSEIRVAPMIRETIEKEDTQAAVQDLGYAGLTFVEPIIAIVNRQTGEKSTVYEYVEGVNRILDSVDNMARSELLRRLRHILEADGIETSDFNSKQILVNPHGQLYLVDTEGWLARKPAAQEPPLPPGQDDGGYAASAGYSDVFREEDV
jgi:hypothetical protein